MKIIGIIGGMGTFATIDIFQKIACKVEAMTDRDYPHIIIDNNSQIPDRSDYILGVGDDPTEKLIESAQRLENAGADYIAISCNTAHYFYDKIVENVSVEVVNMIEETAKSLRGCRKVALLSTIGTIKSGIYDKVFNEYGMSLIKPSFSEQNIIMDFIYKIKKGCNNFDRNEIIGVIESFNKKDVSKIILGCTELPIGMNMLGVEGRFVDPTDILAQVCLLKSKEVNLGKLN